ncbi:MAG: MotA/TolQ/ExbB proton channel family protein [bacterium]|nr:MotA/TolQ/ExbB proton channel family protein [bacterium]
MIAGNSLWHLITQTDGISKTVMFTLLVMSIICWTIFLCKLFLFHVKKRDLRVMLTNLKMVGSVDDMMKIASRSRGTFSGYFMLNNLNYFNNLPNKNSAYNGESDQIYVHIEQSIEQLIIEEERYLPFLSTSATVSPLLGLFGTIWGLIHAFIGISEAQVADIATVAPGIAEALTTTLAGLIVAVPALVMSNYLMVQVRHIENQLVRLGDCIGRVCTSHLPKMEKVCVELSATGEKELQ